MNVGQIGDDRTLRLHRLQMIDTADGLLLKRGRIVVEVQGAELAELAQTLLSLLAAGGLTRRQACEAFPARLRSGVENLIDALSSRRLLVDADESSTSAQECEAPLDVFYWHFDKRVDDVRRNFRKARLTVLGVNCVSRQLVSALLQSGVESVEVVDFPLLANVRLYGDANQVLEAEWPAKLSRPRPYRDWFAETKAREMDCLVATSDFGGQHLLRAWNSHCVQERIQFLPVVLQDLIGTIGPLVVPGESACLECLRARENANMGDAQPRRAVEYAAFEGQIVNAFHPSMASALGDIAAMELLKLYGQFMRTRLVGRLIEVNLVVPEMKERRVLKLPRCAVCGPGVHRSPLSDDKATFMPGHEVVR